MNITIITKRAGAQGNVSPIEGSQLPWRCAVTVTVPVAALGQEAEYQSVGTEPLLAERAGTVGAVQGALRLWNCSK